MGNKKRVLLAVDGNSILNRAYYGIRMLTTADGLCTNAVYGMITMLKKQIDAVHPDYCVIAFDLKAPTFRHKMYDAYKANRKGMPEELAMQLPYAHKCAEAMGVRDKVKIMIGGAPVTEEFRAQIGADAYTPDAASAADVAVSFCK